MASFDRSRKPARRAIPGSVLFGPPPTVPSVTKKSKRRRSAENDSQTKAKAPRRQGAPLRIKMNLPKPDPTPEPEDEKKEDGTDEEAEETEVIDAPARTSPEAKPTPSSAKSPTVVKEEDPELASERHQHAAIAQAVLASLSDNPSLPDDLPALVASLDAEQDTQSAQSQISLRLKKKMKQKAMVEVSSEVWDEENITADSTALSKPKVLAESIAEYGVPKNDVHTERALRRMRIAFTEFDQQAGTPVLAHKALK
ncbi:hypothetical protein IWQ60_001172 [Tieghemiomyces parasiticus]|uniref:Uncharacterized protein n=1 Tax=Tieghemiomyces parasiticus TaxID=78921 RepID=A0A9W8AL31_9FUNG|nr:hypothetical protein IWQ60_001172 [Tieghemiomyces parasiticus]